MPERGETFFNLNSRHQSFDLPETKRTKPLEDNSAQERGETFFPKIQNFRALPRLVNKLSIEVPQRKKPPFLFPRLPPGDDSLGRGGDVFQRNTTLTSVTSDDNNFSKDTSGNQQKPTNFYRRELAPAKSNLRKDPLGQHAGKGGDVFLQKQNLRVSPSPTLPNKPPGGMYQKGRRHFS